VDKCMRGKAPPTTSESAPAAAASADDRALPLVSVIIPAYNSARYIAECLESALQQDYPAREIIVVDDGSTDDTATVLSRYADKVRLLTQANQGSAAARNFGIREARGKYIAFLDADDVWWRHKLRYQVEALESGGHKMAYSRFIRWYPDDGGGYAHSQAQFDDAAPAHISGEAVITGWTYADLLLDCIVWTSTVIVEKTEIERAGLFDRDLRKGQDYDLWLRLSRSIPMLGLERPTALYRIHPASITSRVKPINYEYLILSRAVDRWTEAGPDGRTPPAGAVSARLARSCLNHAHAHLLRGDLRIAVQALLQSLRHSGHRIRTLVWFLTTASKSLPHRFGMRQTLDFDAKRIRARARR